MDVSNLELESHWTHTWNSRNIKIKVFECPYYFSAKETKCLCFNR